MTRGEIRPGGYVARSSWGLCLHGHTVLRRQTFFGKIIALARTLWGSLGAVEAG